MEKSGQLNSGELRMERLIDGFLKTRIQDSSALQNIHLDEDSLAAFAEGNLNEREAGPIISHLVACSFCRHITADLVRLDLAFAEADTIGHVTERREPSKVSEVLNGLLTRIFGTSDGAVFAHNEEDEKKDEKAGDTEKE